MTQSLWERALDARRRQQLEDEIAAKKVKRARAAGSATTFENELNRLNVHAFVRALL